MSTPRMSPQRQSFLHDWIVVCLAPRLGAHKLLHLHQKGMTPHILCSLSRSDLTQLGLQEKTVSAIVQPNSVVVADVLSWCEKTNHHAICWGDLHYPNVLQHIPDPPMILYVRGNPKVLNAPQIAVVGSRKATHHGLMMTRYFTQGLCQAGFVITSGLALGIDAASHRMAIQMRTPTIAVLGSGISHIYPRAHRQLAEEIQAQGGALVSELIPQATPLAAHFPQRNRIISGLSLGTLVVEASERSGSLITARLSGEQGRDVFAVPGSVLNPMTAGCHRLIQQGAKLVASVEDIVSEYAHLRTMSVSPAQPRHHTVQDVNVDDAHQKLLHCIRFEVTSFEEIANGMDVPVEMIGSMLCDLMVSGYIQESAGGYVRIQKETVC